MSSQTPRSILRNSFSHSESSPLSSEFRESASQHLRFEEPSLVHKRRFWQSMAIALALTISVALVLTFGGREIIRRRNKWGQGSWPGGPP